MSKSIVAVTNCPAGIAHTYMVAEAIKTKGEALGYEVHVETQGANGVENQLTKDQIKDADYVILALGKGMDEDDRVRFDGKKVIELPVSEALKNIDSVMGNLEGEAKLYRATSVDLGGRNGTGAVTGFMNHLMAGVSAALPFVIGGGLLMAIGSIMIQFGAPNIEPADGQVASIAWVLNTIGSLGFSFMVPVMGAWIAQSIGGKPALAPAFICSYLANSADLLGTQTGAGFIGAVIIGILVGYFANALRKIQLPKNMHGLMGFLIIPFVSLLVFALLTYYFIGPIAAALMNGLVVMLSSIPEGAKLAGAFLVGAMLAFDMGGPVNKAAWFFSFSLVASGVYDWYGIVGVVTILPPMAAAIATWIRPSLFTEGERDAAIPALIVGATVATEPAIPYALAAPLPMISANVIAGGVAGAISMALGVQRIAPGIGIFDPLLGLISPAWAYYIAVAVGLVLNVVLIIIFKSIWLKRQAEKAQQAA